MITICTDGNVMPFGAVHKLTLIGDSQIPLLPPVEVVADENDAGGTVNFGLRYSMGDLTLSLIYEPSTKAVRTLFLTSVVSDTLKLKDNYDLLTWETDPTRALYVRLGDAVQFDARLTWVKVTLPLKFKPYWVAATETSQTSLSLSVGGNLPTPIRIEIAGSATNPSVTLGGVTMTYTGVLSSSDKLIIDPEQRTVMFNGSNGLKNFTGGFPVLQSGSYTATVSSGTATFKWRNRWV